MTEGRTLKQNNALHLGLSMLADTLNDAGLDQRLVLKPDVSIPWTDDSTKEQLYRPIMKAMTGKTSTTELTTKEISEVWDVLIRHLSEKFGVFVDFPNLETLAERGVSSGGAAGIGSHVSTRESALPLLREEEK